MLMLEVVPGREHLAGQLNAPLTKFLLFGEPF